LVSVLVPCSCSGSLRDLYSFPTRRSSDLGEILLKDLSFSLPKGAKLAVIGANGSGKSTLMRGLLGVIPTAFSAYGILGENFSELDRKSTRLNSSHVSISYAVFCLKKKKKK